MSKNPFKNENAGQKLDFLVFSVTVSEVQSIVACFSSQVTLNFSKLSRRYKIPFVSLQSPDLALQCQKSARKNVRFWVGLLPGTAKGELDWFFSWDPQFSSICSVLRFTQFFGQWPGSKTLLKSDEACVIWWPFRMIFLGKLFARKLGAGTVIPLLLLISHTWRKLHCLTKAEKMDYSRALPMTQATLLPDFSYKTSQDNEELDSLENTSTIEIQVLFKIYKTQNLKIAAQKSVGLEFFRVEQTYGPRRTILKF